MKKITTVNVLLVLVLAAFSIVKANAQSTDPIDSICSGSTNKIYKITGMVGSTFSWTFSGNATKTSGGSTDSITVDWSSTPGIDTITVVESSFLGCPGEPIQLIVVRLVPPTVVLSGTDSICLNSATSGSPLNLSFTGYSPWTVNYTEAGTPRNLTTSTASYNFDSQVYTTAGVKTYGVTTITDRFGCSGTSSGSAAVTVFPKPTTGSIVHY